jgi:cell division protein FtsB
LLLTVAGPSRTAHFNRSLTAPGDNRFMIIHTRRRHLSFLLVFHTLAWGASGYFAHSAYSGNRGLVAKQEAKVKTQEILSKITEAKTVRTAWERRVAQLSGAEVDRDLLDERQRLMLNLAHKNDLVIQLDRPVTP